MGDRVMVTSVGSCQAVSRTWLWKSKIEISCFVAPVLCIFCSSSDASPNGWLWFAPSSLICPYHVKRVIQQLSQKNPNSCRCLKQSSLVNGEPTTRRRPSRLTRQRKGFKKIVLDTCSSVEEARETVDEIFRALVKASVQYKLAKENLSNMGKLTTEQKKARANERRDEQQAQDRALREELCLNINSDFFDQYVLCIRGNDNIKTMKVRIVQQVFPQLVGNTAGAEKKIKDLTLYKNDVINPCDQPSHKKAVLADSWMDLDWRQTMSWGLLENCEFDVGEAAPSGSSKSFHPDSSFKRCSSSGISLVVKTRLKMERRGVPAIIFWTNGLYQSKIWNVKRRRVQM